MQLNSALVPPPRALLFDVFGTCVNWRKSVTESLVTECNRALENPSKLIPPVARSGAGKKDWADFAQRWRNTYITFVASIAKDPTIPWKTIDEHHHDSLKELLDEAGLVDLWTPEEVRDLSLVWHRLEPWNDSADGIGELSKVASTCTLSNGNLSLLRDLKAFGDLPFTHLFSAEQFNSYKPSPRVYLGAVGKLGLEPRDCAMVAAHLGDLKAAKACGLRAIYVERPGEEGWNQEMIAQAKQDGWVDLWVPLVEKGGDGKDVSLDGFLTVATRLGIEIEKKGKDGANASL
ncbi:haloacid dehalogenase [Eremomyces bilateralis CBS 781.70]|uniref:Haloacid dehalogenase n=1 Tax=Eremomyces bilateralis CBS 781.70 TaxID=1392243 RepID=A0A6G1FTD2_9PEZI|nr:haloacid dehalogenase [Eremomyces bilateralis CBS 781.70]KAF1809023.1 haloacid dehalogenase [Eremomyces bilateralis CBS 781.70]